MADTDDDWKRAEMYRLADRTFRYRIYVAMEVVWNLAATYVVVRDMFFAPGDAQWVALALLITLSLAHSMTMTLEQPWHLLKAFLVGGIVFAAAIVLDRISGAPTDPAVVATVVGSGYYFWLGELWTRKTAASAAHDIRLRTK